MLYSALGRTLIASLTLAGLCLPVQALEVPKPASGKAVKGHKAAPHEEDPHHWSYQGVKTGPNEWGMMNPAYSLCREGKAQSPVNITSATPQQLESLKFSYGLSKLQLINNGHTIQVNIDPGSFLEAFGDKFELKQFHFHTPSEEQIRGKHYAMVAHLVHKNAEGALAVVAVLFQPGREHGLIDTLFSRLPSEHGESRIYEERMISPASLLPERLNYYTLMGSLTTPPCSEGVRWIILKQPVDMSSAQLTQFRRHFPMNARPVQPLNGRMVFEAM
ncbi:carbonic anhydrase [Chitinimonas lacunae]|uniref:carbonic anhydrase n=1 Tax=Chitinimonas lacunae TaxID=1963018 RepID=A0ABV8MV78_9NEIS